MVNVLASRMAGLRLALIIGAILLPFLFVTFHLSAILKTDISRAQDEKHGIEYVREVMPLLFAAARNDIGVSQVERFAKINLAIPAKLVVDEHHVEVRGLLNKSPIDSKVIAGKLSTLIDNAKMNSGISLDPMAETYFFGQLSTDGTRSMLGSFINLGAVMEASNPDVEQKTLQSYAALAALEASVQQARRAMNEAQLYASSDDKVQIATASEAIAAPLITLRTAYDAKLSSADIALKLQAIAPTWLADIEKNWKYSSAVFEARLLERISAQQSRMNRTLGVVAAACLVSLGTAFSMFRSTLRRLDDLSFAKSGEERARVDAERTNERLSEINNDIVHLNKELADKMGKLKDAQDELVKKGRLEQLGQLTATVAHELRNPLGAVRTSAFLLERKVRDKGLGVEAQLLRINNGIARCDNIITQLLDFSRTKQIAASAADLDAWLENVVEEEARKLPAVVSISCDLGLQGKQVQFDPARLLRAVINLVNNASEALVGTGDDPSRFAHQEPTLKISTRAMGSMVALMISDNGPGIPEELLSKIREPLFTTKSFGTGLGIPAVEQIAVQHGGRLEINSKAGEGAHFTILIPFEQQMEEAA